MAVRPLSKHLQKKAEKEINEDPKRVAADVSAIREWLCKQPHLQSVQPSDQWLMAFLRGCKFNLETTKEKFDMYYTLRSIVPEFYSNRDPMDSKIQEILKLGAFLPVRTCKDDDSTRVCIMRIGVLDPSQYHLSDLIKVALMINDIMMLEDDNFIIFGEDLVVDVKGVGVSTYGQWTPTLAKKSITCLEKALPVRVKSTHFLNPSMDFEAAFSILKGFAGEKLKKRVEVHNKKYKDMHKSIPKKVLPEEYEGKEGTLKELTEYWKVKVESYRNWFIHEETAKSDESKRPESPRTSSQLFGVEGSFRKLEEY